MKDPLTRVWEVPALGGHGGQWPAGARAEPGQHVLTVGCCGHW